MSNTAGTLALLSAGLIAAAPAFGAKEPVYAVVGARVVTVSGGVLEKATLVMRDGVIEAVGQVEPPRDARVFDGTGLTLTPGLIDGFSGLGLPEAKPKGPGAPKDAAKPEAIAPQAVALDKLQAGEALKAREAGITGALVVPAEGILPGRSVFLSLSGEKPEAMALKQPAAMHLHMTTRASGYPDSLMGTVALARQALWNAIHYRDSWAAYRAAPLGKKRPAYDSGLEAWQDVLAGRIPLVVTASRENDIRRALLLQGEFEIKVAVAGAPQAARLAGLIKAKKLPLLIGVNFDPPKASGVFGGADEEQERQDIDEAERNPAELERAGVRFGFGSGHAKDYLAGIRKAVERGLSREAALRAATLGAAEALGVSDRLGSLEKGKLANVVAWSGEPLTKDAKVKLLFADGQLYEPFAKPKPTGDKPPEADKPDQAAKEAVKPWSPPLPPAAESGPVAIVGATLLTVSPQGTIEDGTLVFEKGRISALGRGLKAPAGARIIDGRGLFVMPGIIDAHSHTAIEDNVNECTDSITAEVRVEDVLDQHDPDLYRQLAGGVTALNVLHGSCNAIGGQNAVIKTRYGQAPERLLFEGAPRGIKFALGENPKRANFRRPGENRYPGTRMGVEATLRGAFLDARAYQQEWDRHAQALREQRSGSARPVAPRKDLRLEELKDILEGKVFVHSHCYRADEILMLIRVADEFGFKIRTFQHVLEGYKVASEIAKHGAGGSTFIDWWAYKLEAWDAIPYNPAVMAAHGVKVSLNSDSAELARRLYWDAAKAVKYGGVREPDALAMITLNPAEQLGIDKRVGSLEPGKDADLAVFSAHPFSPEARVELTFVDGLPYFDRSKAVLSGAVAGGAQ